MIFITLGSQKFQFNRLLKTVDDLIAKGAIRDEVFAQIGCSDYKPQHYKFKQFLDREAFLEMEANADIIITHGGTGAIIGAVKKGKKVIAIPRLAKYGEHVDDHQIELISQFKKQNLICGLNDCSELEEALCYVEQNQFDLYISNTDKYIVQIEEYIQRGKTMKNQNVDIQIIVATHKAYQMPEDKLYLPLHVGAEGKKDSNGNDLDFGYTKDNSGDNISVKNPAFCELTGLYWAWKNLKNDYIGLAHYRRHFMLKKKGNDPFANVLTMDEVEELLHSYKVIVPIKRNYYIETLYSHYAHTHYAEQLDTTREIIREQCPEYLASFDLIMRRRSAYMFNMMIMERELIDEYCTWLFNILFELEKKIDMPNLSAFQGRFYGRVSEVIFNVWLDYQIRSKRIKKDEIKELRCIHMEKINWWRKGTSFLKAKFFHQRYEASF